jgi:hypothetical protein
MVPAPPKHDPPPFPKVGNPPERHDKEHDMPRPTRNGDSLAWDLNRYIGTTHDIRVQCAILVRNARTLHNLAVAECNGSPWEANGTADREPFATYNAQWWADLEQRQERAEARIRAAFDALPVPDEGGWRLRLNGDPRGAVVSIEPCCASPIMVERGAGMA